MPRYFIRWFMSLLPNCELMHLNRAEFSSKSLVVVILYSSEYLNLSYDQRMDLFQLVISYDTSGLESFLHNQ